MRRAVLFVVASCVFQDAYAQGAFVSGDMLYTYCENNPPSASCKAYVAGAVDTLLPAKSFCLGEGVTVGELCDVVFHYLQEHRGDLQQTAFSLVAQALEDKFPCNTSEFSKTGPVER